MKEIKEAMKNVSLRGKTITIVGPSTFETLLKAHYLTHMTGVRFRFFHEEGSSHPSADDTLDSSEVVLVDCRKGKVEGCLSEMKADSELNGIFRKPIVLFNVAPEDVRDREALDSGIKGLLSHGVSPDIFLETVIDAVCGSEVPAAAGNGWVQQS